ncbi:MAG: ring-opening amidohydrolase [Alcanivorax sp.]|nr:ring-opening amidohydrolase [Alcanivorax sp.]
MRTRVLRFPCAGPDDLTPLREALADGRLHPERVVAVLGKTEGNGCVNDFTRAFATTVLKRFFAERLALPEDTVAERIAFVMSGGTEGGLSPHWLVFEVDETASPAPEQPGLAAGIAFTETFAPEQIGRLDQVRATAAAVRRAMAEAGIERAGDVHYVQIKCPLLTAARCEQARQRGATVATTDTYESMGYSRGASALGVALALGEVDEHALNDAAICHDFALWSGRASTSAGIELMRNEILVLGNAPGWHPALRIGHDVMVDALDGEALDRARATLGDGELVALLAKAEPSRSGEIRGRRHTMWDDSDINATRHARALVGGVLGGRTGDLALFVSGGAEHQGPDGGGPLAVIVENGS